MSDYEQLELLWSVLWRRKNNLLKELDKVQKELSETTEKINKLDLRMERKHER